MTAAAKLPKVGRVIPNAPSETAASDRPLPIGWRWLTVGEMATEVQYGTSAKTGADSKGVPVIRMGNIQEGALAIDSLKYLPARHDEFPDLLLRDGDLLFNRTNSAELVGKSAVYRGNPSPASFASYLIRAQLKPEYVPEFLAYYINSPHGRQWVSSVVSQQVGQANVNGTKLKALRVPVPPLKDQRRIVAEIEKQFTRLDAGIAALRRTQANLKRYRAAVLKAACEGHTLLRLPTGIFYAQGVKANVLFFDRKPAADKKAWTEKLWIYDLRTNQHFTLKENTLKRSDLDDFVACYNPKSRHTRKESERFKSFTYDELIKRDKVNLDIFWLKDDALEDSANLPAPGIIAADIVADLEAALEQFAAIEEDLKA